MKHAGKGVEFLLERASKGKPKIIGEWQAKAVVPLGFRKMQGRMINVFIPPGRRYKINVQLFV